MKWTRRSVFVLAVVAAVAAVLGGCCRRCPTPCPSPCPTPCARPCDDGGFEGPAYFKRYRLTNSHARHKVTEAQITGNPTGTPNGPHRVNNPTSPPVLPGTSSSYVNTTNTSFWYFTSANITIGVNGATPRTSGTISVGGHYIENLYATYVKTNASGAYVVDLDIWHCADAAKCKATLTEQTITIP